MSDGMNASASTRLIPGIRHIDIINLSHCDSCRPRTRSSIIMFGVPTYCAGTPYPDKAFELAEQVAPHGIVLGVMLPDVDGWDLLGRLRSRSRGGSLQRLY